MRTMVAIFAVCAAFRVASAAEISIKEYDDRIEVVIDGSMDPRLAVQNSLAEAVSRKVSELDANTVTTTTQKKSSSAAARKVEAGVDFGGGASPVAVSPNDSTDNGVTVAGNKPASYNRGEQVMAFMSKLPKRSDYVESRLEARQTRWAKRLSGGASNQSDGI